MPLLEKIAYVSKEVEKILGRYKGFVKVIYNKEDLHSYLSRAISIDYLLLTPSTSASSAVG